MLSPKVCDGTRQYLLSMKQRILRKSAFISDVSQYELQRYV
jgi:hypothetical protein